MYKKSEASETLFLQKIDAYRHNDVVEVLKIQQSFDAFKRFCQSDNNTLNSKLGSDALLAFHALELHDSHLYIYKLVDLLTIDFTFGQYSNQLMQALLHCLSHKKDAIKETTYRRLESNLSNNILAKNEAAMTKTQISEMLDKLYIFTESSLISQIVQFGMFEKSSIVRKCASNIIILKLFLLPKKFPTRFLEQNISAPAYQTFR